MTAASFGALSVIAVPLGATLHAGSGAGASLVAAFSYGTALAAFGVAGASNAPFFTATLAARSRYSPERARAQVFVSLAGMTVAVA